MAQALLRSCKSVPMDQTISTCNKMASTVIAMIESGDAIKVIDEIAAVEGVDVLLIGSADLTVDMGIAGHFESEEYRGAVQSVSAACKKHGKVFGMAGVYDHPEMHDWMVNEMGVRFMLLAQDTSCVASGAARAVQAAPDVMRS